MIDFTKNIPLDPLWHRRYTALRIVLAVMFIASSVLFTMTLLFPVLPYSFDFAAPDALKNSIVSPRNAESETSKSSGIVTSNESLHFNINLNRIAEISQAHVSLAIADTAPRVASGTVSVQKSYRAFFLPDGNPVGFPSGTLLKSNEDYYIISDNQLRMFSSIDVVNQLGYNTKAFLEVPSQDLQLNARGENVFPTKVYPQDTLFEINGKFYQLSAGSLHPFVSQEAFLTHFNESFAITKDVSFLQTYPLSPEKIGYADGTLASSGQSIFIVSNSSRFPVGDPRIFSAMGYDWNDVHTSNEGELGTLHREKLFTENSVHPDGTVFKDITSGTYYLIRSGTKHPLSDSVAQTYLLGKSALHADTKSFQTTRTCTAQKSILPFSSSLSCNIDISALEQLPGNDYQFTFAPAEQTTLSSLSVNLQTARTKNTAHDTLGAIKKAIIANYNGQPQ